MKKKLVHPMLPGWNSSGHPQTELSSGLDFSKARWKFAHLGRRRLALGVW